VETDFRVRPAGSGDRRTDIGRLLITCPDQPGSVATVSGFRFSSDANITKSRQYSADPFGGTFFHRTALRLKGWPNVSMICRRVPVKLPTGFRWAGK
jgi:formyltetrahydrofolate hydrolase